MRKRFSVALVACAGCLTAQVGFQMTDDEPGPWPAILSSVGLVQGGAGAAAVYIVRAGSAVSAGQWQERAAQGAVVVVEGESELAAALGFRPGAQRVAVRSVVDRRNPKLAVVWEKALELPVWEVPREAEVFVRERWTGAPLVAGLRRGVGGLLWLAVTPGALGYERFPYLPQALCDLGLQPPLRSRRLWAFFDSSYRLRVDLDYFAARWRKAGIVALHVAAWHYFEPHAERDAYLARLIHACHRNAITVYAWLELPHVSETFWREHPEWREKTALLQDAHLDWRRLMNLNHPACAAAVETGVRALAGRFDWDGVNLAELYFESLEGHANPARFTPFNQETRFAFRERAGFDALDLFNAASSRHHTKDPAALRAFLDFRAGLAQRLQEDWIARLDRIRRDRSHLDLVLTHVDDRLDTNMRDRVGADAARLLPLLERHDFTFLVEDPATVWHLGPQRYPQLAERYRPLVSRPEKLAIDVNIVERYQDVYPTRQQTGSELLQLVHLAARAFPRVALYSENSILAPDLDLLAAAAAVAGRLERKGDRLVVDSPRGVGVNWNGPARVNGRPWPATDGSTVWLPPGPHVVEPAPAAPRLRLAGFSGDLQSASALADGLEFSYRSASRALALVDRKPARLEVDGVSAECRGIEAGAGYVLFLPRGQHLVAVRE
ncbi:MAG: hypothetical protein HY822_06005 [Acidobacteria bacterium]|nr:hypothetical protein [Acidobacteriota bacterium]